MGGHLGRSQAGGQGLCLRRDGAEAGLEPGPPSLHKTSPRFCSVCGLGTLPTWLVQALDPAGRRAVLPTLVLGARTERQAVRGSPRSPAGGAQLGSDAGVSSPEATPLPGASLPFQAASPPAWAQPQATSSVLCGPSGLSLGRRPWGRGWHWGRATCLLRSPASGSSSHAGLTPPLAALGAFPHG